jgi:hypothetical protein
MGINNMYKAAKSFNQHSLNINRDYSIGETVLQRYREILTFLAGKENGNNADIRAGLHRLGISPEKANELLLGIVYLAKGKAEVKAKGKRTEKAIPAYLPIIRDTIDSKEALYGKLWEGKYVENPFNFHQWPVPGSHVTHGSFGKEAPVVKPTVTKPPVKPTPKTTTTTTTRVQEHYDYLNNSKTLQKALEYFSDQSEYSNFIKEYNKDNDLSKLRKSIYAYFSPIYQNFGGSSNTAFQNNVINLERYRKNLTIIEDNIDSILTNKPIKNFDTIRFQKSDNIIQLVYTDGVYKIISEETNKEVLASKDELDNFIRDFKSFKKEVYNKLLGKLGNYSIQVIPAVITLKNPTIKDYDSKGFVSKVSKDAFEQTKAAFNENKDGVIYKNIKDPGLADNFGVFDENNIHILGTLEDIEQFKSWKTSIKKVATDAEITAALEEGVDQEVKDMLEVSQKEYDSVKELARSSNENILDNISEKDAKLVYAYMEGKLKVKMDQLPSETTEQARKSFECKGK